MDSAAVKQDIVNKVQAEASLANARTLIQVGGRKAACSYLSHCCDGKCADTKTPETPRSLLRALRTETRRLPVEQRADVHDELHRKVHGRLEQG